jgi:hypothetical protein
MSLIIFGLLLATARKTEWSGEKLAQPHVMRTATKLASRHAMWQMSMGQADAKR